MESDSTSSYSDYSSSDYSSSSGSYGVYSATGSLGDTFSANLSNAMASYEFNWSEPSYTSPSFGTPALGTFDFGGSSLLSAPTSLSLIDYYSTPAAPPPVETAAAPALPAYVAETPAVPALPVEVPAAVVAAPPVETQEPVPMPVAASLPEAGPVALPESAAPTPFEVAQPIPVSIDSEPLIPSVVAATPAEAQDTTSFVSAEPAAQETAETMPAPALQADEQPQTQGESALAVQPAEQTAASAPATPASDNVWSDYFIETAMQNSLAGEDASVQQDQSAKNNTPVQQSAPQDAEAPTESEAVASPIRMPGEIETTLLGPLPPEKQTTVAKAGDTLWKYAGGDVAAIGDLAIKNDLKNSQIISGKTYDTTPIDRDNLTPADLRLREQIGQAYLNQDNARLAALAEIARQQQAERQLANWVQVDSGVPADGSFAQLAQPAAKQPAGASLDPRLNGFLNDKSSNVYAGLAQSPGVILGRSIFNAGGYSEVNSNSRAASQSGVGTSLSFYQPGEVSVLGIDNYSVTSMNKASSGMTLGGTLTYGANGWSVDGTKIDKAQSLLTDTMFETQSNGIGKTDESLRVRVAYKQLGEVGKLQEVRTDGVYADMNKKSVSASAISATGGVGISVEVASPFGDNRKVGGELSAIVDFNGIESKQMSAAGSVANPNTGIYGAAFGFESRNRLASASLTINAGVDVDVANAKLSAQAFKSAGAFGGGGTASYVWNDKTGTLTLQATSSFLAGIGAGFDLSGEIQSRYAAGIVNRFNSLLTPAKASAPRP